MYGMSLHVKLHNKGVNCTDHDFVQMMITNIITGMQYVKLLDDWEMLTI